MSSDSKQIRNLGYIAWKNDLSWMEKMSGKKWDSLINIENKRFKDHINPIRPLIKQMDYELRSDTRHKDIPYILDGWRIEESLFSPQKTWTHIASGFSCKCWDADISEDIFVAAVQVQGGFGKFTTQIFSLQRAGGKPRHLKSIPDCGPHVAVKDNDVFFLHSDKDMWYSRLRKWSQGSEDTIFELKNLEENLELKRGEDGSVYLVRSDFTKKHYSLVNNIKWHTKPHLESCIVSDDLCLSFLDTNDTIESFSLKAGWAVTISKGIRTLWKGNTSVVWVWGDIFYDSRNPFRLDVSDIRYEPYTIILPEWKLSNPKPSPFPCSYYNNPLPVFLVHPLPNQESKGLLVTAYGAYGTPTHVGSLISKWKPLLLRGWIIASVMVPGSGDDDKEWIKKGQRLNRLNAIDQLAQSVKSLQYEHNITPINTALYGRSAGGLLVASVAIRNPGLIRSLYIESPYIDILRTISNPELPLTTLETSEYGISEYPTNLIASAAWSPIEHIPKEGMPDLHVIARAGLNDLQVLPYEVLKFIKRIRGPHKELDGCEKLVYIHNGRGHFTTSLKSRAEDLALLESFLMESSGVRIKNIGTKYKMPMTRKNNKNRSTRKNRKNLKNLKNRKNKNTTMGGRRKSGSRGRKH